MRESIQRVNTQSSILLYHKPTSFANKHSEIQAEAVTSIQPICLLCYDPQSASGTTLTPLVFNSMVMVGEF